MTQLQLNNLDKTNPAGYDFLVTSESYMEEINGRELDGVTGGLSYEDYNLIAEVFSAVYIGADFALRAITNEDFSIPLPPNQQLSI